MHLPKDWPADPSAHFPIVPEQPWSTIPASTTPPTPHLRNVSAQVRAEIASRLPDGPNDLSVVVWKPPYAGETKRRGLTWGYTLVALRNDIYAYQRVVFSEEMVETIARGTEGTFCAGRTRYFSAW